MKITLKVEKEFEVSKLKASCGVRYWEGAVVNGQEDTNGDLMPCRKGDLWEPLICVDTGVILNWEEGKDAEVFYKVCDAGIYTLLGPDDEEVMTVEGYVINMMDPDNDGYGDYIGLKVSKNGQIQNWKADFEEFLED